MANEENLKHFTSNQSREEAVRNGKKGGIKSGETRRKKRSMKQAMNTLLSLPVIDPEIQEKFQGIGVNPDDTDYQMLVMYAMVQKAVKGNVSAAQFIASITGDTAMSEAEREKIKLEKKRLKLEEKQFALEQDPDNDEIKSKQDAITGIVEQLRPINDDEVMGDE